MWHRLRAQSTPWQADPVDICCGLLMDIFSCVLAADADAGPGPAARIVMLAVGLHGRAWGYDDTVRG